MSAYFIVNLQPKDPIKLEQYSQLAGSTLVPFGGEYAAKGAAQIMQGTLDYHTTVLLRFPDREHALNWYQSKAYQALIPLREEAFDSRFYLIGQ